MTTRDVMTLDLPSGPLSDEKAAEIVGLLSIFPEVVVPLALRLRETELAGLKQAEQWGSKGFEKGGSLVGIFRDLAEKVQPIHELLPPALRGLLFRTDPAAIRVCYYLWLKFWRQAPDDLLYGAALLHGCYQGAFVGLAERINRNAEILFLRHDGQVGAFEFLVEQGLGGPGSFGLRGSHGVTAQAAFDALTASVVGFGRRRGVPAGRLRHDPQKKSLIEDEVGVAAVVITKSLPGFPGVLDTETRRLVRRAGFDYINERRKEKREPLTYSVGMDERRCDPKTGEQVKAGDVIADPRADPVVLLDELDAKQRLSAIDEAAKVLRGTSHKVYKLMRQGKSQADISRILGCSKSNVTQHRNKIREALAPFDPN